MIVSLVFPKRQSPSYRTKERPVHNSTPPVSETHPRMPTRKRPAQSSELKDIARGWFTGQTSFEVILSVVLPLALNSQTCILYRHMIDDEYPACILYAHCYCPLPCSQAFIRNPKVAKMHSPQLAPISHGSRIFRSSRLTVAKKQSQCS